MEKKYPDPDAICAEASKLAAALLAISIPGDADVKQQATNFQMCLNDESDYDCYEFYLEGMALLRSLLRMRIRLKKTAASTSAIAVLSAQIETLRALLIENERYIGHLFEMDHCVARARFIVPLAVAIVLLFLLFIWRFFNF